MTEYCERCSAPKEAHGVLVGFGVCDEYRSSNRRRYYLYAVGMWVLIVAIAAGLASAFPFLRTSLLSFVLSLFGGGDYNQTAGSILDGWPLYIFGIFLLIWLGKTERIYRYARYEEETYRRGAERWSLTRRTWMCFRFGLAHFWNIIISFALVIGLSVAGVYFMLVYLRRYRESGSERVAVAAATHAHVAYNRVALGFFATILALLIILSLSERVWT